MTDNSEIERLEAVITQLRMECENLRAALAKCEEERDWYLKAIYQYEREKREFADLDYDDLMKISAGPVELIE